ncbi:MAG: IS110 family transposase [Ignavibacteria bacterium]|nr:IS110 family transposase [Ignavibacteria bacterium]
MRPMSQATKENDNSNRIYIGMDVHKKHIDVTLMSQHIVLAQAHIRSNIMEEYIRKVKRKYPGKQLTAAYEAGFSGFALCKQLNALGVETIVVNAADIPTTNKERTTKSDRSDSMKICKALKSETLRKIYVPSDEQLGDRDLVRYRSRLRQEVSKHKTRIKMFIHRYGIHIPDELDTSHWSKPLRAWLGMRTLPSASAQTTFGIMLENLETSEIAYQKHLRRINELASSPRYADDMDLLCTIPGIGRLTAITILTELNPISRFRTIDHLASYVGLVPMRHQSGSSDRSMPMQHRAQQELRVALVQSAWMAARSSDRFRAAHIEKRKNRPSQVAIIYVARKLLNTIYTVLKNSQPYVEQSSKQ